MRGDASRRPRGGLLEAGGLGKLPPAGSKSRRVVRHTHGALRSRRNRTYTTWKLRGDRAQAAALPSTPHAPGQILSNRGCHVTCALLSTRPHALNASAYPHYSPARAALKQVVTAGAHWRRTASRAGAHIVRAGTVWKGAHRELCVPERPAASREAAASEIWRCDMAVCACTRARASQWP